MPQEFCWRAETFSSLSGLALRIIEQAGTVRASSKAVFSGHVLWRRLRCERPWQHEVVDTTVRMALTICVSVSARPTVVLRHAGHAAFGPSDVDDQSKSAISDDILPGAARNAGTVGATFVCRKASASMYAQTEDMNPSHLWRQAQPQL